MSWGPALTILRLKRGLGQISATSGGGALKSGRRRARTTRIWGQIGAGSARTVKKCSAASKSELCEAEACNIVLGDTPFQTWGPVCRDGYSALD